MKIIAESHLDHGLSPAHIELIERCYKDEQCQLGTIVATFTVPPGMSELYSTLRGPSVGDRELEHSEVFYRIRGTREGATRFCYWPPKVTREITAVMGIMPGGEHAGQAVLFTAYPGPQAPREPWDSSMSEKQKAESVAFWAKHALAYYTSFELDALVEINANRQPHPDHILIRLLENGLIIRNDHQVGPDARDWRCTAAGRAACQKIPTQRSSMAMCGLQSFTERGRPHAELEPIPMEPIPTSLELRRSGTSE